MDLGSWISPTGLVNVMLSTPSLLIQLEIQLIQVDVISHTNHNGNLYFRRIKVNSILLSAGR